MVLEFSFETGSCLLEVGDLIGAGGLVLTLLLLAKPRLFFLPTDLFLVFGLFIESLLLEELGLGIQATDGLEVSVGFQVAVIVAASNIAFVKAITSFAVFLDFITCRILSFCLLTSVAVTSFKLAGIAIFTGFMVSFFRGLRGRRVIKIRHNSSMASVHLTVMVILLSRGKTILNFWHDGSMTGVHLTLERHRGEATQARRSRRSSRSFLIIITLLLFRKLSLLSTGLSLLLLLTDLLEASLVPCFLLFLLSKLFL